MLNIFNVYILYSVFFILCSVFLILNPPLLAHCFLPPRPLTNFGILNVKF